jgi:hypothetical protein
MKKILQDYKKGKVKLNTVLEKIKIYARHVVKIVHLTI